MPFSSVEKKLNRPIVSAAPSASERPLQAHLQALRECTVFIRSSPIAVVRHKGYHNRSNSLNGNRRLFREPVLLVLNTLAGTDWIIVRNRIIYERENLAHHPELAPPLVAQQVLISGEDHRHALHPGFDVIAICRAIWRRLAQGRREGGSTIEQQLVRTITGRYERTIRRKLKEILLSVLVNVYFGKSIIPSLYISIGYYGWRMNGFRQACQRLQMRPPLLTLAESAALIARLKYPEPQTAQTHRVFQIHQRKKHLMRLYRYHIKNGTYEHLNGNTLRGRPPALRPAHPISES